MSTDILNRRLVLSLNRNWQPHNIRTVKQAITDITGGKHGVPAKMAMDIELDIDEQGNQKLVSARPVTWSEWITLPIRSYDLVLHTHQFSFRCPTVIICVNYGSMPVKNVSWSPNAVRVRDKDTCQVSGRKLKKGEGNTAHLTARAKQGVNSFENTVYMDRRLNALQGTKTIEEMGWKLLKKPTKPPAVPASVAISQEEPSHITWAPFLL